MNKKIIEEIIGDVLEAFKYPDGALKNKEEIIQKYSNYWQEEIETKFVDYSYDGGIETEHFKFKDLYEKYIGKMGDDWNSEIKSSKVKIKCKDGLIQIERKD